MAYDYWKAGFKISSLDRITDDIAHFYLFKKCHFEKSDIFLF